MTAPLHIVDPRCPADLRSSPMRATPPPGGNWVVGFRMGAFVAQRKNESRDEYLARRRAESHAEYWNDPDSERARQREKQARLYAADPEKFRAIGRDNMAKRRSGSPDEVRAYKRDNYAKMSEDPDWLARHNAASARTYHKGGGKERNKRQYLERRAAMLDALGHPTHCGVCGVACNHHLGVIDLRFTDPDRWAALMAWSLKGAPVVPTGRKRTTVRRHEQHPALFEEDS